MDTLRHGLWGVLATPFRGSGMALDLTSLENEIAFFASVGADGLVVLGVFGEGKSLTRAERARVIQCVASSSTELPVVVGLPDWSTAVEDSSIAVSILGDQICGVMAIVDDESPLVMTERYTDLHQASGAGVVVQDYPQASGVRMQPSDLARVISECPFTVAAKEEAPPTSSTIALLSESTSVPVFGGLGGMGLIDELAAGAAGAMTGFSHPEALRQALDSFAAGGFSRCREAMAPWLPLANFEAQPGIGLAIRKEILHRRGIIADPAVRAPNQALPPAIEPLLSAHLAAVDEGGLL